MRSKKMDVIATAKDLMGFRTETGNREEIMKCLDYCQRLFKGTDAIIEIAEFADASPVLFIRNQPTEQFDALCLGHLDVVPASDDMFVPKVKDGKLYGRGSLDMKSFAAVALNSMEYVLKNKLDLKFGVILSTDEEKGSCSTHAFLESHPHISATIVLDNDTGGDIHEIVTKCKNPVFVKITAKGIEAHGSTPWEGIDANELMMKTLRKIRELYPYYSKGGLDPENKWIDTVHVAKLHGGEVSNVICGECEALLDFRLTENSSIENLQKNLDQCMIDGVNYKIVSESTPVVMDENNPYIQEYKKFAEHIMGEKIKFVQIGGATDSRAFAVKGSTVIMHSGSGEGMHTAGEYVVIDTVKQVADIQIKFLEKLSRELSSPSA